MEEVTRRREIQAFFGALNNPEKVHCTQRSIDDVRGNRHPPQKRLEAHMPPAKKVGHVEAANVGTK
eukprot:CAMPEP_0202353076 /NCGR_PEP_ID=MMETSP1126-20121109/8996_1 /ASSEMBLY_ACC=CAM_ASM_000457 /TAXON_ID=3047 /ORGANISM="Dunaliella tertiolecta, Strain CCMP1320" /LENGTH=65 /DNA_ID=CAMNT_0048945381 /DNA_START=1043 /DNA_END=1240 /DNA_ORIENTATION=-